eukprot:6037832-Lingulodinium_polyedra.AAC.1
MGLRSSRRGVGLWARNRAQAALQTALGGCAAANVTGRRRRGRNGRPGAGGVGGAGGGAAEG